MGNFFGPHKLHLLEFITQTYYNKLHHNIITMNGFLHLNYIILVHSSQSLLHSDEARQQL